MQLARIIGNAVTSHSHKSLEGWALFLCQPIDENGNEIGDPVVAINPFGGGMGSLVVVSADGKAARKYTGDKKTPLRHVVVALADD